MSEFFPVLRPIKGSFFNIDIVMNIERDAPDYCINKVVFKQFFINVFYIQYCGYLIACLFRTRYFIVQTTCIDVAKYISIYLLNTCSPNKSVIKNVSIKKYFIALHFTVVIHVYSPKSYFFSANCDKISINFIDKGGQRRFIANYLLTFSLLLFFVRNLQTCYFRSSNTDIRTNANCSAADNCSDQSGETGRHEPNLARPKFNFGIPTIPRRLFCRAFYAVPGKPYSEHGNHPGNHYQTNQIKPGLVPSSNLRKRASHREFRTTSIRGIVA